MAAEGLKESGWIGQVGALYETFLLRDLLGYAFPGAVLIMGLGSFAGWKPLDAKGPLQIGGWLAIFYTTGVSLRLVGTMLRLLVISTDHSGLFGDPWELKGLVRPGLLNWFWRGSYDSAIVEIYKMQLRAGADVTTLARRESLFLHLAGNLGFALFLLSAGYALILSCGGSWVIRQKLLDQPGCVGLVAESVGVLLIVASYRHARAIRLLYRARESLAGS